jgi:DNA-binding winged helix-turn-helix (wHTH) protein/tetratricopeptide (TPR) repeat protein
MGSGCRRYFFEDCALDTDHRELRRGANLVPVEPQVFDLLVYLIRNRERVVSKDDLLVSIWHGRIVSESALNTRISAARFAIGDNGEDQRLIKTFPRKGLRFVGAVREDQGTAHTVPEDTRFPAETQIADAAARPPKPTRIDQLQTTLPPKEPESSGSGARPSAQRWQLILGAWSFPTLWRATPRPAASQREPATVDPAATLASDRRSLPNRLVVVVAVALVVLGTWVFWPSQNVVSPPRILTMMAAPTIAVLPFTGVGSQHETRLPAAGFETEVRSELAQAHRGFDLTIRSVVDDHHGASPAKVAGSRLGARYLVVGTTWLDGEAQRLNIELIEAETDRQIWSELFELTRGQNSASNRLAARVARLLVIQVRTAESQRPLPVNVEAGHYVLRGRALHETERGAKSTSEAQSLFMKALQLDSRSGSALQGFATTKLIQIHNGWIPWEQRPSALIEAEETIERLVKLDPGHASGHYLRASLLRALGQPDKGIASLEHALSLNPNYVAAHAELGRSKIDAGRAHEAIGHIEEAIRLSPPEPNIHLLYFWAGLAALHIADDQSAVQWLLKARQANPSFLPSALHLPVAYLGVGEEEKARAAMVEFLSARPGFRIAASSRWVPSPTATVTKQRKRIVDALRRLGVQEDETAVAYQ